MTDSLPPRSWRTQRRLLQAFAGAGLALGLITAADAALPWLRRGPPPAPAPPARLTAAAAPPVLIAFREPAPGYPVISPFGLRILPWEKTGRLHAGVDIAAPAGLPVRAVADGVVTRAAIEPGYGRFVEVRHAAGLSTVYAHLGRFLPRVAPGVAVEAGAPLGVMGSTGVSTGSHVHFEVRDPRGRPLNPELFLGRRFARAGELPLRAAAQIPRGVRVAYVSRIPKAKRDEMAVRADAEEALAADDAAAEAAADAGAATGRAAPNVADAAVNADARPLRIRLTHGRPHARLQMRD